jgi:hypothetical protein
VERSTADERSFYQGLDLQCVHTFYLEAASSLGEEITPASEGCMLLKGEKDGNHSLYH